MNTDTCQPFRVAAKPDFTNKRAAAPSDEALIASIAQCDQGALRILFSRHYRRVFRFVLRFVKDRDAAESIVNDVFLIAWQQAGHFEGRSQVATWLLGIARYRALGALKPRRSRHEEFDDGLEASLVDGQERVDDRILREDSNRYLRRCIRTLPREQAQLIELHYFQEVSLRDAAELTGIPVNTIKTRMFLARRKLARMMAAEDTTPVAPALMSLKAACD